MIRTAFFACICLMIVCVGLALGVLSQWDMAWCFIILPACLLLAYGAAEAAVERYLWTILARAERRAYEYRKSPVWDPQVQRSLNIRVQHLAGLVR